MSPLPRLADQADFTKFRPRRDSGASWLVSAGASLDRELRSIFFQKDSLNLGVFSPSGLVATSIRYLDSTTLQKQGKEILGNTTQKIIQTIDIQDRDSLQIRRPCVVRFLSTPNRQILAHSHSAFPLRASSKYSLVAARADRIGDT